jgi:cobalt-zinc-cadmium resistance protein CzcA
VLRFDPARLAQYGVPRDEALAWAEVVTTGHLTGSFAEGDGRTPIVVRVPPPPGGPSAIGAVSIPLPDGSTVPLSTLATITLEETPVAILREDLRRFVEVRAAVRGRDPGETLADARAALGARLELPHDVSVTLDGEALAKPSHP